MCFIYITQITSSAFEVDALTFNIRFDNANDGDNAWPKRKAMVGEWIKSESPCRGQNELQAISFEELCQHHQF